MTLWWIFPLKLPPAAKQFTGNIWPRLLIASGRGWVLNDCSWWTCQIIYWVSATKSATKCSSAAGFLPYGVGGLRVRCHLLLTDEGEVDHRESRMIDLKDCEGVFAWFGPFTRNHASPAADRFFKWSQTDFKTDEFAFLPSYSHHTDVK